MRLGMHFRNQMCATGQASSMWPIRSRRTFDRVTSTPQRSQIMPLCLMRLYLPHSAFVILDRSEDPLAEQAVPLGLEGPVVDGFGLLDLAVGPRPDDAPGSRR
jgi:hypothetical protein